jgi:RHS repeat-associated protein
MFECNRLRCAIVSPLGSTTSYLYNTFVNGRLPSTGTDEWTTTYQYGCGDQLTSITRGSVTSVAGNNQYGYTVSRDPNGRIIDKVETINGQAIHFVYAYDDFGRLLTVSKDGVQTESYSYDSNGNRIRETNTAFGIADRELSWSVEDHAIQAGDITYRYDQDDYLADRTDGNGTTEYFYSSTGELLRVTLPDSTEIGYINDPQGRRIAKKANSAVTEKYLWSSLTTLLAVYDAGDNLKQRFLYADGRMPYAMIAGGTTYYLHYDQVDTLRLVTDSQGGSVKQIDYDTFGNILSDSNAGFTVPFGYAGGLHDRDTHLVRFGYRDYLPEIGKWMAKDPIGFAGGDSNLFGYVSGDPVNFIDPEGLETAVVVGHPTSGNPFGHVAIGFSGQGVYSYGTKTPLGGSFTDYLSEQAAYRDSTVYILQTTPEQEAKMKEKIMEYEGIPLADPRKDPIGSSKDTCATRTQSALEAGGMTSVFIPFTSPFPVDTQVIARRNSASHVDISNGATVPGNLSVCNK